MEHFLPDLGIAVDGFDPVTNTVYEFHGSFWHGDPNKYNQNQKHPIIKNKTFGDLYRETLDKESLIKNAGYNLISNWG